MPNIHNLAFPLEKYGMKNADHTGNPTIFYPIDEPHGMIKVGIFDFLLFVRCSFLCQSRSSVCVVRTSLCCSLVDVTFAVC
jgi:hypothetical protein